MGSNPLPGYNALLFAASESALGTIPAPADVAAFAALAIPTVKADLGPVQTPAVRAKQDRGQGRGMTDGYISGRYEMVPWNVMTSLRTRADADDPLRELALWKACGFVITTNSSTSVVVTPGADPLPSDFVSVGLTRILGRSPGEMELERLAGCFAESVRIEGGDKEVMLTFAGQGQSKGVGTSVASLSVADGSTTSVTVSADESYAFLGGGYYIWESEIVLVAPATAGATSITITRAQLGTSGAAHSSQPMYPYVPTGISYGGSPIPESLTTTVTFDGSAFKCLNWSVDLKTGLAALPGETGSALPYQGVKATRYDATPSFSFVAKGDDVRKLNKARARKDIAVSFLQGTTAGGILTVAFAQCEVVAMKFEDNANDTVTVTGQLRCRDVAAGGGMFALTFT